MDSCSSNGSAAASRPNQATTGDNSSFSSPLPPCPEDPPAPPPPSCTPPKYRPLEENENTEDERDEADSVEGEPEQQVFPTPPPPPPSPPMASPMGTPPPPPPPPYSPPNMKLPIDLGDALQNAERELEIIPPPPQDADSSYSKEADSQGITPEGLLALGTAVDEHPQLASPSSSSSSSTIAALRVTAREREILAEDYARDPPAQMPRFYIGDIENYTIIDKVGSGTYGYGHAACLLKRSLWRLMANLYFVRLARCSSASTS